MSGRTSIQAAAVAEFAGNNDAKLNASSEQGDMMRIAYLDCASGISGDMTLGALVDAGVPLEAIQCGVDSLKLPDCRFESEVVHRKGFRATKVHVRHEPEHAHRHLHHITDMISSSELTEDQKDLAIRIFTRLGEAEAHVHGTTIEKVHFHEVGAVDSIADIVGSAIGWDLLAVDQIVCSPIPTGSGHIRIAHGRTSIPAPATAELLKGIPLGVSPVVAELTTPTGAAIVATLADGFQNLPPMTIDTIGYGAGDRDFEEQANVLRILVGDSMEIASTATDQVVVLETNLDDVTAEVIGHCTKQIMESGALDCFTTSILMKKNRPGTMLSVICELGLRDQIESLIFRETGSLGIRRTEMQRTILDRRSAEVDTPWGKVAGKVSTLPDGSQRFSPEFESCKNLAEKHNQPINAIMSAASEAFSN